VQHWHTSSPSSSASLSGVQLKCALAALSGFAPAPRASSNCRQQQQQQQEEQ
jgi:hypothetical protein